MRHRRGFTLVELLVVAAIISALLAILLPSMGKSIALAQTAAFASNLRQMQTALVSYGADHVGKPYDYYGNQLFLTPMERYIQNVDAIRYCPRTSGTGPGGIGNANQWWSYNTVDGVEKGAYGHNGFMYGLGGTMGSSVNTWFGTTPLGTSFPSAWWGTVFPPGASQVPTFFDAIWVDAWPHHNDVVPTEFQNGLLGMYLYQMSRATVDRHGMAINIVYADGHAERVKLNMLWNQQWSATFVRQGKVNIPD